MPKNIRFNSAMGAACCALALAGASGRAEAASSDYDWIGILYVWAADIGVDTRDRSVNVDFLLASWVPGPFAAWNLQPRVRDHAQQSRP